MVAAIFNFQFWAGTVGMPSRFPRFLKSAYPKPPLCKLSCFFPEVHTSVKICHISAPLLETSRNVTKSKRSLHWCRSISKKYLCTFYYSISQKVITLSGRRFITVSGGFITLSGSYYSIGRFYYIIGQLLQYRAFITLSVGTGAHVHRRVAFETIKLIDAKVLRTIFDINTTQTSPI